MRTWFVQDADGGGFTQYANMLAYLADHEAKSNVTVYKQIWNEPDLTSYFNYSDSATTFFHGTATDYNDMYRAGATAMAVSYPSNTAFPFFPTMQGTPRPG